MEAEIRNKHSEKRKLRKEIINYKNTDYTEESFEFDRFKYSISSTKCSFKD